MYTPHSLLSSLRLKTAILPKRHSIHSHPLLTVRCEYISLIPSRTTILIYKTNLFYFVVCLQGSLTFNSNSIVVSFYKSIDHSGWSILPNSTLKLESPLFEAYQSLRVSRQNLHVIRDWSARVHGIASSQFNPRHCNEVMAYLRQQCFYD